MSERCPIPDMVAFDESTSEMLRSSSWTFSHLRRQTLSSVFPGRLSQKSQTPKERAKTELVVEGCAEMSRLEQARTERKARMLVTNFILLVGSSNVKIVWV